MKPSLGNVWKRQYESITFTPGNIFQSKINTWIALGS